MLLKAGGLPTEHRLANEAEFRSAEPGPNGVELFIGPAHPFEGASSCPTVWQLLPGGGRRKGTS